MNFCEGFVIDAASQDVSSSDSESDCAIPVFDVPAFHKFGSSDTEDETKSRNSQRKNSETSTLKNTSEMYVNVYPDVPSNKNRVDHQKEALKQSIKEAEKKMLLKPGFETWERVPTFMSRRQTKKIRMKEKEKTKGFDWYHMKAPEMTEDKKNDLTVLKMRKALDPKHFYKRSALNSDSDPKYFEIGTYEESPLDFYSSRIPKKQRKQTLVEELLADAEFRSYQKKKMSEILQHQHQRPKHFKISKKRKIDKLKPKKKETKKQMPNKNVKRKSGKKV